jgi:hypothetical protein
MISHNTGSECALLTDPTALESFTIIRKSYTVSLCHLECSPSEASVVLPVLISLRSGLDLRYKTGLEYHVSSVSSAGLARRYVAYLIFADSLRR